MQEWKAHLQTCSVVGLVKTLVVSGCRLCEQDGAGLLLAYWACVWAGTAVTHVAAWHPAAMPHLCFGSFCSPVSRRAHPDGSCFAAAAKCNSSDGGFPAREQQRGEVQG